MRVGVAYEKTVQNCNMVYCMFVIRYRIFAAIYLVTSTSLMGVEQIVKYPPEFIPSPATLRSFIYVFKNTDFFLYLKNSSIITILNIVGTLISTTLVAYGFAKYDAKLKGFWFTILMSTMMIPYFVTIIPLYNILREAEADQYDCTAGFA